MFEATWGPMWVAPPPEVSVWVAGVIATMAGWLAPEQAVTPVPE